MTESSTQQKSSKVYFYDTTLRDGEQTPGIAFSREKRLEIVKALDNMNVDQIEIGFAASGKMQRDDMRFIIESGLKAKTLSLARPIKEDIDAALEVGVDGVILFMGFSDIHLQYKFRLDFSEALERVRKGVEYAKGKGLYVQVSAEDGTRTPNSRLREFAKLGRALNVDRICIADTVGIATPALMKEKVDCVLNAASLPVAVHCHNDFGLAVINSVAAVEAGARYLAVTMNGLGERSGNASLEQCALALTLLYGYETNLKLNHLTSVARLVSDAAQIPLEPTHPIIGRNCFRHESGIHVAAILKNPECYEAYDPSLVGGERQITLGKTSGKAAVHHLANALGESLSKDECRYVLEEIQRITNNTNTCDINTEIFKGIINQCRTKNQ